MLLSVKIVESMSVRIHVGDLFLSDAQTMVNAVNCAGIMGKGIALEFKRRFPEMFTQYVALCAQGEVHLGEPYLYRASLEPWVLNFPTKEHWRSGSRLSDIVAGLNYLEQNYEKWGITSLAVPALGCGLGGLEWRVVGPTLYQHLSRLAIPVFLFAPVGTLEAEREVAFLGS
jgi:O-acetyl-ADP-ribose deacetylase (regulator of RNase III)